MKNKSKNNPVDSNICENFIRLRGWDIRCVDKGFDEAQVRSIIAELISQRNELAKKMENISSLNEQAKKTVIEADEFASELKVEAVKNAEAEKATVMARIEESTRRLQAEYDIVPVAFKGVLDGISHEVTSIKETFNNHLVNIWTGCEERLNKIMLNQNEENNTEAQEEEVSLKYRPRKSSN